MPRALPVLPLLLLPLLAACPRSADPRPAPEPTTTSTSTTSTLSTSTAPAKPSADADPLGPVDLACTTDADCVASELSYSASEGGCCQACFHSVANRSWYARAQKRCHDTLGFGKDCPEKKCAAARPVACKSGTCDWGP